MGNGRALRAHRPREWQTLNDDGSGDKERRKTLPRKELEALISQGVQPCETVAARLDELKVKQVPGFFQQESKF
jgi:hypothetical protein